jgi:hypothetical protein
MKYKLPRQVFTPEIAKVISREMKTQKFKLSSADKKDLEEIKAILAIIEKEGIPEHLVCKKLTNNLGHGIFLHPKAKPLEKGEIIAPYAGDLSLVPQNGEDEGSYAFEPINDLHLSKEEQAFFDPKKKFHPGRLYSLKLDALKKGNFTRFINHSEKPNVVACMMAISKNSMGLAPAPIEIIYMAKKKINPGEQLLVSYEDGEKSYWSVSKIKPFPMTPKTFKIDESLKLIHKTS